MDPIFASVMLGFFLVVVAVVAVAYRQSDLARTAIDKLTLPQNETSTDQSPKMNSTDDHASA